jgi:hypothetical protein
VRVVPEGIAQNKPPDKAVIPQKRKSSGNSLKRTKSSRLSKPSTLTVFLATFIVQMLATCDKFSGSDHKHSFTTGILDSGNNRHHCFNSAAFFPYGVRWTKINVNPHEAAHAIWHVGHIPPSDMPELPPNSAAATPNGSVASPADLGTLLPQNWARLTK